MAYYAADPRKQQRVPGAGGSALRDSLGLSAPTGSPATPPDPSAPPGPAQAPAQPSARGPAQRQGGFVNFGTVLQKAAPAVQSLGAKAVANVETRQNGLRDALGLARQQFEQKTKEATPTFDPGKDPYAQAGALAAGYKGPATLSEAGVDTAALRKQQDDAAALLDGTKTQGGMAVALGYGEKDGSGASAWDAMLAGAGAGGRLESMRGGLDALRGSLGLLEKDAGAMAERGRSGYAAASAAAQAEVARAKAAGEAAAAAARSQEIRENAAATGILPGEGPEVPVSDDDKRTEVERRRRARQMEEERRRRGQTSTAPGGRAPTGPSYAY